MQSAVCGERITVSPPAPDGSANAVSAKPLPLKGGEGDVKASGHWPLSIFSSFSARWRGEKAGMRSYAPSPIDFDAGAGDEIRLVGRQIEAGVGDVDRLAETP